MKKKILILGMICIMIMQTCLPVVKAVKIIHKADLTYDHKINTHLQFDKEGEWHDLQAGYICYEFEKEKYPAYCISHGIHGVDEEGDYTVTIEGLLTNANDSKGKLIYNTIINGYPYKTASQLGVESSDDAYVATKQAIYSVLLDRNIREFYRGKDERGNKIINAIETIALAGKTGNAQNKDASITIQKIGTLVERQDDYYQEYIVNADVAISTYTVEDIEGFSNETKITDINGNPKRKFENGQHFQVVIPKKDFKQDIQGSISLKAACQTKPVFFGKAPNGNVQNYAITFAPNMDYLAKENVQIKTNTAMIQIIKKDAETEKPIEGVSFSLYSENEELLDTAITNQEGIATFSNLYEGNYQVKETKENENYIKDDNIYSISTIFNKKITKVITNQHKKGNLKIIKVDKDDHSITLGGIEFDLLDSNKKVIAHLITDANGEAEISNINIGTYTLQETKTKREYDLCTNTDIIIEWNLTTEKVIENEKQKGQIQIIKEDKDESAIKLKGVTFQIYDKNNKMIEEITTNEEGIALSSKLLVGEYTIQEVNLGENKNYILNPEIYTIQVNNKEVTEINIQNEYQKGSLKIVKEDKDNTAIKLEGIEFNVLNEKKEIVAHLVTNEKGEAYIDHLRAGKYILKEIKTKEDYTLAEDKEVVIHWNTTTESIIRNEKKKGQIEVYKTDKDNSNQKISGVEFAVFNKNFERVDRLITNEKGHAISKKLLIGQYYLKEIKTNPQYILEEELIPIQVEYNKVLSIQLQNEQRKGQIKILKVSSKDSPLFGIQKDNVIENVTFEIYNPKGELIDTVTTNEKGEALSKSIPIGRYKIIERNPNSHYLISKQEIWVMIKKHKEVEYVRIENEPKIPEVRIEKIGKTYAEKNEEIPYEFIIQNKSNTELENFTWKEYLPYEKLQITQMVTGTYNEKLDYEIYYKTNLKDYRLFQKIHSWENKYLDFQNIQLEKNEIITEIKVEYHHVSSNFQSITSPVIYGKISPYVKKEDKIRNIADLSGTLDELKITNKSEFETIIIENKKVKKLPKTGC